MEPWQVAVELVAVGGSGAGGSGWQRADSSGWWRWVLPGRGAPTESFRWPQARLSEAACSQGTTLTQRVGLSFAPPAHGALGKRQRCLTRRRSLEHWYRLLLASAKRPEQAVQVLSLAAVQHYRCMGPGAGETTRETTTAADAVGAWCALAPEGNHAADLTADLPSRPIRQAIDLLYRALVGAAEAWPAAEGRERVFLLLLQTAWVQLCGGAVARQFESALVLSGSVGKVTLWLHYVHWAQAGGERDPQALLRLLQRCLIALCSPTQFTDAATGVPATGPLGEVVVGRAPHSQPPDHPTTSCAVPGSETPAPAADSTAAASVDQLPSTSNTIPPKLLTQSPAQLTSTAPPNNPSTTHHTARGPKFTQGTPARCTRCDTAFPSRTQLYTHLQSCTRKRPVTSLAPTTRSTTTSAWRR